MKLRRDEVEEGRSQRYSTPHLNHIGHSAFDPNQEGGRVRLIVQGQKGGTCTDHDHYNHSSLHHDHRSVYDAVVAEEDINVEGIKVGKEECMRKSDLQGIVSLALNPISTKKEQHILIKEQVNNVSMLCEQNRRKGVSAKKCFRPRPLSGCQGRRRGVEAAVEALSRCEAAVEVSRLLSRCSRPLSRAVSRSRPL
jgi:hypothetical protein